jgi:hypothetical protein
MRRATARGSMGAQGRGSSAHRQVVAKDAVITARGTGSSPRPARQHGGQPGPAPRAAAPALVHYAAACPPANGCTPDHQAASIVRPIRLASSPMRAELQASNKKTNLLHFTFRPQRWKLGTLMLGLSNHHCITLSLHQIIMASNVYLLCHIVNYSIHCQCQDPSRHPADAGSIPSIKSSFTGKYRHDWGMGASATYASPPAGNIRQETPLKFASSATAGRSSRLFPRGLVGSARGPPSFVSPIK